MLYVEMVAAMEVRVIIVNVHKYNPEHLLILYKSTSVFVSETMFFISFVWIPLYGDKYI